MARYPATTAYPTTPKRILDLIGTVGIKIFDISAGTQTNDVRVNVASVSISTATPIPVDVSKASMSTANPIPVNVINPFVGPSQDYYLQVVANTLSSVKIFDISAGTQTNDVNVNVASVGIGTATPIPVNVMNPFLGGTQTSRINVESYYHGFGISTIHKSVISATMSTIYDSATVYSAFLLINDGANPVYFGIGADATTASMDLNIGENVMLPIRHSKLTLVCATGNTAAIRLFSFGNT